MKKIFFGLIACLALLVGLASFAGFPPSYLMAAPGVATGIGSKLLCSARYVSRFSQQQSFGDLVQYSGILQGLTVEYDEAQKSVTTSLFGLSKKTASYSSLTSAARSTTQALTSAPRCRQSECSASDAAVASREIR